MNTDFHIDADRGQRAQKTGKPLQSVKAGREHLHASEPTTILGALKRKRRREENAILASVLSKATEAGDFVPKRKPASSRPLRWDLPGFERNCRVATQFGYLPVQALRKRDKVKTLSGVYREVQWIDEIRLDEDFLARHPEAYPVLLRKNVFGVGRPASSLLVSPDQPVRAQGPNNKRKPIPAANLIGGHSICRSPQTEMTYFLFHCGTPETVCIDGLWFFVSP